MPSFAAKINNNPYAPVICAMGLQNQMLISKALDLELLHEAKQLQLIDCQLVNLLRKAADFDFIAQAASGKTLLIGEGNLSFALALTKHPSINARKVIASTFKGNNNLSEEALANAEKLETLEH